MTPSPEKWSSPPKNFLPIFSKNVAFSKKLLKEKIFKTSFPIKEGYIHFPRQMPPSLQKSLAPKKRFLTVFSENTACFICDKKVMLIFGA